MRAPWHLWRLQLRLDGRPNVGWLMDLCDENYRCLLRLAPGLRVLQGRFLSRVDDAMDLYMEVLEQTPYTTLVHLTYYFEHVEGQRPDPDIRLRIYHDSGQAEVLEPGQSTLPLNGMDAALERKWKASLFLAKWLAYCLQQGHRFGGAAVDGVRSVQ